MRDIRGASIGTIFQEPMTSLNPVLTIGRQISEVIERHEGASAGGAHAGRSTCSGWSGSPIRRAASTNIRTSCQAAWPSA